MSSTVHKKKYFLIVTTIFILCSQSSYSQCNLERSKDEFTSVQTVNSHSIEIASVIPFSEKKDPWNLAMSFYKFDANLQLVITFSSPYHAYEVSSIFFKFKDESVIKMSKALTYSDFKSNSLSYKFAYFLLTKEDLMKFASEDLIKFHVEFYRFDENPVFEKEIKNKIMEKIKKDASCMLLEVK